MMIIINNVVLRGKSSDSTILKVTYEKTHN